MEGRTCPHPLPQMQMGYPVAMSSEIALALHTSGRELKKAMGAYGGAVKGLGVCVVGKGMLVPL